MPDGAIATPRSVRPSSAGLPHDARDCFASPLATAGTVRMYVEIAPMSASVIFEKLCSIASAIGPAACARPGTLPVRRYWTSCCCVQPPIPALASDVML